MVAKVICLIKNSKFVIYYYNETNCQFSIYFCNAKLNFQNHYSSVQTHDPSEIITIC